MRTIRDVQPVISSHRGVHKYTDHAGTSSDLRVVSSYVEAFDRVTKFHTIASELLDRGHSNVRVGQVMGGNSFRAWKQVSERVGI